MKRPRSGFTLVELLTVLAIVGILLALLLPAVQSIRAQASGLACQHNLRQIGIALHAYHDGHGAFPATFSTKDRPYVSWLARILTYIDQGAVWQQSEQAYGVNNWPWQSPHPNGTEV